MIGVMVPRAPILSRTPNRPSEKRSLGRPPPFHLFHSTQEIVMTYEQVNETDTSDIIALKPTAVPKFTHVMTKVIVITVHSAV